MKFGRQHWVEKAEAAMRTRERGNDLVHPRQLAASKAASSARLTACWMVVTVGVWLGTELNPFEAR